MALGIECLLADDAGRAFELAQILDGINCERRGLQQVMVDDADELLRHANHSDAAAICVFDACWHPGVIGLVASKLKDRLHRPVIAFAPAEQGSKDVRGSARSIAGLHVRDALVAVDAMHPGLIARFGGHAMAAGLSMPFAHLDEFVAAFVAQVEATLDPACLLQEVSSDGPLLPHEFSLDFALMLRIAGPWGQGFPEPAFDDVFELQSSKVVGARHLRMKLRHSDSGAVLDAIMFNASDFIASPDSLPTRNLRAVFQLDVNEWNGTQSLQLLVRHLQPA